MSLGAALQGLVNGFASGRQIKHGWEDRKDEKVRTKRADEIRDAAEKRAQESHDIGLTTTGLMNDGRRQALRTGEQQWQDFTDMRRVQSEADAAAEAGMQPAMGALPAGPAPVPVGPPAGDMITASTSDQPARPRLSFGSAAPSAPVAPIRPGDGPALSFGSNSLFAAPTAPGGFSMGAAPYSTPEATGPAGLKSPVLDAPPVMPGPNGQVARQPAPAMPVPGAPPVSQPPATGSALDTFTPEELAKLQAYADQPQEFARNPDALLRGPLVLKGDDGKFVAQRPPASDAEKKQLADLAKTGQLGIGPGRNTAQQRIDAVNAPQYEWGNAGQAGNDIARAGRIAKDAAVGAATGVAEGVANTGIDFANTIGEPGRRVRRWMHGDNPDDTPFDRVDVNDNGSTGNVISPVLDALRPEPETPERAAAALAAEPGGMGALPPGKDGKPASKGQEALASGAAAAMDAVGESPDMQAAASAVPASALGAKPGRQLTEAQTTRGAKTFMDSWRKNGAPLITKELLRQGRLEEAQQLDTWVKSAQAQEGMELWAKGQFQAQMGDVMGAYDTWIEAFNSAGYYDDGYEILKDQSSVIRDRGGNPIGVNLTFRDQATGETHSQQMSPADMGQTFGLLLSPTEAFKASQERQAALQKQLLDQQQADQRTARELIVKDYDAGNTNVRKIFDGIMANAMLTGVTPEEAWEQAQRIAAGQGGGMDGVPNAEVPVLRRPQ